MEEINQYAVNDIKHIWAGYNEDPHKWVMVDISSKFNGIFFLKKRLKLVSWYKMHIWPHYLQEESAYLGFPQQVLNTNFYVEK